jgi:beta-glucosidase
LKGFQKVLVTAEKSESITIQVPVKGLAYYNVEIKKWLVEPGIYNWNI